MSEKVHRIEGLQRRFAGKGPPKKVRRKRFVGEEKAHQRRSTEEEKGRRRREHGKNLTHGSDTI